MALLEELEARWSLSGAVARFEDLRLRDSMSDRDAPVGEPDALPLSRAEALELLALGEVIARKAVLGRQLGVRTARAAGASWAQIGQTLGMSRQSAWEAHNRWIDGQAPEPDVPGHIGLDEVDLARTRELAGVPDTEALP